MSIMELSCLTAIGIVMAFALGFLFGTGCEQAETKKALRRQHEASMKAMRQMEKNSIKAIENAFQMGRNAEKSRIEREWQDFIKNFEAETDNIKYGGF